MQKTTKQDMEITMLEVNERWIIEDYDGAEKDVAAFYEDFFYNKFKQNIIMVGRQKVAEGLVTEEEVKITQQVDQRLHMEAVLRAAKFLDGLQSITSRATYIVAARIQASESWRIDADAKAGNINSFTDWVDTKLTSNMDERERKDVAFLIETLAPSWEKLPVEGRISTHLGDKIKWWKLRQMLPALRKKAMNVEIAENIGKEKVEKAAKFLQKLELRKETFKDTMNPMQLADLDEAIEIGKHELQEKIEDAEEMVAEQEQELLGAMGRSIAALQSKEPMNTPGGIKKFVEGSGKLGMRFEGLSCTIQVEGDSDKVAYLFSVEKQYATSVTDALKHVVEVISTDPKVMKKQAEEWFIARK